MDSYHILIIEDDLVVAKSLQAGLLREGFNALPIQPA
jgi:DNA-binding response OmpR family regulator